MMLEALLPQLLDAAAVTIWDADPIAFEIGSLQFRWYGLLFAAALMQGYFILRWQYRRAGEDPDRAIGLVYLAIAGIIIGARLGHVIFYEPERYFSDPIEIVKFWKGGLASHGATIGLVVTVAYYSWSVRKIPMRVIADRFALMLPLATSCVRLGNFFNSEIVGRPTDASFAFIFPRHDMIPRHPSQLYEVTIGLVMFAIVFAVDRFYQSRKVERPLGLLISVFLLGYFSMRFGVEYFKEYQEAEYTLGSLTMGQKLSIPFALAGLVGIWASLKGPWKGQTESQFLALSPGAVTRAEAAAPARRASSQTLAEVDDVLSGKDEPDTRPSASASGDDQPRTPRPSRTAKKR